MAKLPGLGEYFATVGAPAINFGRGLLGYQDPFTTQTMQDRMAELEAEKGPTGNIGYEDYGLKTATPGGRFTGGLMGLALNNPVDFGLAGSIGRYSYSPQGRTGLNYDFTPDQDTGTTGNAMLDFINAGGVKGALSKMGTAQAAEVIGRSTPRDLGFIGMAPGIKEAVAATGRPSMADIAGLGDLGNPTGDSRVVSEEMGMTGTPNFGRPSMADIAGQVNENLIDRGNPFNDSRVVSEEQSLVGGIPDRGRGMPGTPTGAYEMIGGTPVAVGDVLGMQQALEKSNLMDEPTQGINYDALGILGTLGGLLTGSTSLKGLGMLGNYKSGRTGRALGAVSKGLGSLGSRFAGTMRGINPTTGRPNTQAQYEANRSARQTQSRIDNMLDRKAKGKSYSEKNLSDLIGQQIAGRADKSGKGKTSGGFTNPGKNSYGPHSGGGGGGGGGGKIVCTMMNERYGFGSFRNKIWMKFHEHHGPEYQKGYHAIFLPLVKIAKGEGKINTAVRKVLEHMGRHVTADMFKIMKGKKRDTLGRIYRAIFEPACHIIGKIKSALGRG